MPARWSKGSREYETSRTRVTGGDPYYAQAGECSASIGSIHPGSKHWRWSVGLWATPGAMAASKYEEGVAADRSAAKRAANAAVRRCEAGSLKERTTAEMESDFRRTRNLASDWRR